MIHHVSTMGCVVLLEVGVVCPCGGLYNLAWQRCASRWGWEGSVLVLSCSDMPSWGLEGLGQRLWEQLGRFAGELAAEKQAVAAGGQEVG